MMRVAKILLRLLRQDLLRDGAVHRRAEQTGLVMIDDEGSQPGFLFIGLGRGRLGPFEKVTQVHELVDLGDVFFPGRMQHQELTVAASPSDCHWLPR